MPQAGEIVAADLGNVRKYQIQILKLGPQTPPEIWTELASACATGYQSGNCRIEHDQWNARYIGPGKAGGKGGVPMLIPKAVEV